MPYRIAGIDVHKKMLAVVVSDVEVDGDYQFERRLFGSNLNNCDRSPNGCSNRLECLLEEAHIKLSIFVSNLLGISARRMLKALAEGETNSAYLTTLADRRLRARRSSCVMLSAGAWISTLSTGDC
jgi:hypothetical protein